MNAQDEEDFVFACLLGAYIQSLRQQEQGQQQLQRGNARVQQSGRRRRRRMRRPRSMWVREWLSEDRRQQLGHYTRYPSHYGPPPSFVTAYYVLSRFVAFTPFYYGLLGFSSAPWLPWQIFWQFKNLARHPRPVTFAHSVPPRCLTSIPFCPRWPETWLPWPPGT